MGILPFGRPYASRIHLAVLVKSFLSGLWLTCLGAICCVLSHLQELLLPV